MTNEKITLLTGASSGIGLASAEALVQAGHKVYGTLRKSSNRTAFEAVQKRCNGKLCAVEMDVCDEASVQAAVDSILKAEGRLDLVINNAGFGVLGPLETVEIKSAERQFDVNFFGVMRVLHACLPSMRKQKSGQIINISSIGGFRSTAIAPIYCASKFALEGLTEALAADLLQWNISVSLVEPGPVNTPFPEAITLGKRLEGKENPYEDFVRDAAHRTRESLKNGQAPEDVAELIVNIAGSARPNLRYQTSQYVLEAAQETFCNPTGNHILEAAQKFHGKLQGQK